MVTGIILGISTLLFTTALGLLVIFVTEQPFLHDITALGLVEATGYSREQILENYRAMMHFLLPFSKDEWHLPSMAYSASGAKHFYDCRPVFNAFFFAGAVSLIIIIVLCAIKKRSKRCCYTAAVSTLCVPAVVIAGIAVNFNKAFVIFHKIFFDNDDWLFDPRTDEIINILPEEFFYHCAVFIAACWILGCIFWIIRGRNR